MNTTRSEAIGELHMFPHRGFYLAFHPGTFSLFRISNALFKGIQELQHGTTFCEAAEVSGFSECDLSANIQEIQEKVEKELGSVKCSHVELPPERPMFLSLHVSNACNLRCVYCYAGSGSYGRQPRTKMGRGLAIKAIDTMYRNFPNIESIIFFGGEPTLAMDVIESVCKHVEELHKCGKAKRIPEYGIVTNGTRINDEAIRIVKQHDIRVTMSIDGPQKIHDLLRPTKGARGSYELARAGFNRLVTEIGQVPRIEATYTRAHVNSGMRMQDLGAFLRKEFQFRVGAIIPVHLPEDHPLALTDAEVTSEIEHTTKALLEAFVNYDSPRLDGALLAPTLLFLRKRSTRFLCSVGHTRLSVMTDGEIYPCHRLMSPHFLMGTIHDFDIAHPSQQLQDALDRLAYCDKHRNPRCRACWARPFCMSCPGADIFVSNNYQVPERFCQWMCTFIEDNLSALYDLKSNPPAWSQFLGGLHRFSDELGKQTQSPVDAC